jgi:hypothetical protein
MEEGPVAEEEVVGPPPVDVALVDILILPPLPLWCWCGS